MVEPAITAAIASGKVPSSISANYLMQNRDHSAKIAIIFVGFLTFLIVVLRCSSRIFLVKRFGLDDALAASSLMLQIAFIALSIVLISLGSGRHIEYIRYVLTESQSENTEILDFAAHLIYTSALFVCRLSGLAFYHRLCELHDNLSIAIKCTAIFLIVAYLSQIALIVFHCNPVTGLWPYSWQMKSMHYACLTWGVVYLVNSVLSLVCDIFMFTIPVALIHVLKLPLKSKLRLYLVLLPGLLVIIISIIRLYLVVQGQWLADGSWFYDPMLAIENAEIGGTLIALSIPGLKPLLGTCFTKIDRSFKSGEILPSRATPGPKSHSDNPFPVKTTVTIGTRGHRPVLSRDSLLELGEGPSYITYEVNIQSRDMLPGIRPEGYPRSPSEKTGRISWPFGLKN